MLRDHYYQIIQEYILVMMDDAAIERFYDSNPVASGEVVLSDFTPRSSSALEPFVT
ncbi:hypothetical protein V6582_05510 [Agrobacterium vitis]|uniref:hypothetical protein n=1 Tax=Agrobacterium vitis TaxID=373 RepID=UPI0012E79AE3|nr:hypothetical protein [Agrobacterium vitis]MVA24474.1 hypothetical protein [Agrobacterium vitis]